MSSKPKGQRDTEPDPTSAKQAESAQTSVSNSARHEEIHEIAEADGFCFPTKRRAYVRGPHLKAIRDLLLISLDLSNFRTLTGHS
jgi:hypothetical protein